jgi:hypothetical protein
MRLSRNPFGATPLVRSADRVIPGSVPAQRRTQREVVHTPGKRANKSYVAGVALITVIVAVLRAPLARAEDSVTYEIVSDQLNVPAVNVEYNEHAQRKALQQVSLPWRMTVGVPDAASPTKDGAEIRADWRQYRWPYKYVTVRIYLDSKLLCESTLDVGDATCYGSTPHRNFPQTGGG